MKKNNIHDFDQDIYSKTIESMQKESKTYDFDDYLIHKEFLFEQVRVGKEQFFRVTFA
jgi:hypothetical protein